VHIALVAFVVFNGLLDSSDAQHEDQRHDRGVGIDTGHTRDAYDDGHDQEVKVGGLAKLHEQVLGQERYQRVLSSADVVCVVSDQDVLDSAVVAFAGLIKDNLTGGLGTAILVFLRTRLTFAIVQIQTLSESATTEIVKSRKTRIMEPKRKHLLARRSRCVIHQICVSFFTIVLSLFIDHTSTKCASPISSRDPSEVLIHLRLTLVNLGQLNLGTGRRNEEIVLCGPIRIEHSCITTQRKKTKQ
jgi:hypothetical protein